MLHGRDVTTTGDMRPRCDSLPGDQTAAAAVVGSKRKSILKKEALNREETEGLLSGSSGRVSRNSTPRGDGTAAAPRSETASGVDHHAVVDDDDEEDQLLVVRHLPRLYDSASADPPRRVHPLYVNRLPTSPSVATIAEFDTDCEEESSVEGELDSVGRPPLADSRTNSARYGGPVADRGGSPKYRNSAEGACGGSGGGGRGDDDDDGAQPVDNVRSPQNANVPAPLSQQLPTADINLNPPPPPPAKPRVPVRPPSGSSADTLGNHLPHQPVQPPLTGDQPDSTAFTHNLFPTLDYIDEFAD